MRCSACGKFLSAAAATNAAKCSISRCAGLYHKACIGVPELAKITPDWKCPECKIKNRKSGNSLTPVTHASSDYIIDTSDVLSDAAKDFAQQDSILNTTPSLDLGLEMHLFREELRELRKDLKEFRTELFNMRNAITGCSHRIDDLESRMIAIEKVALDSVDGPKNTAELCILKETVSRLEVDLNERDQELLQGDIEISNLPEVRGENPIHTVTVLASKLGISIDDKDVIFAERVGPVTADHSLENGLDRGRRLIVRFNRRSLRDDLLKSARVRRNATTADMGLGDEPARRFYINERLTKKNRQLFFLVRQKARKMQWKYIWTKRGHIYARKGEGLPVHSFKSEADIFNVFGIVQEMERDITASTAAFSTSNNKSMQALGKQAPKQCLDIQI